MIGIYEDIFITYLKKYLGDPIIIRSKNIVCRCPWCEINSNKKHYHLNISTEVPIFHCFYSGCNQSGMVSKLLKKINSVDNLSEFINLSKINLDLSKKQISNKKHTVKIPKLSEEKFYDKSLYIKHRLKFSGVYLTNIPNLIFDIRSFFSINPHINIDSKHQKLLDFYHSNFIGFLSHNESVLLLRNINPKSSFRYLKIKLADCEFIDYYRITGYSKSNIIVLAEGPFDILVESIFDRLNLRNKCILYASCMSTSYEQLIKSISFHENIFNPEVIILSDSNISINYYKKIRQRTKYMINSLKVFYNMKGKDFGDFCIPERII